MILLQVSRRENNFVTVCYSGKTNLLHWNKVRINTTLIDAKNEMENWNWFLNQQTFNLKETNIQLERGELFLMNDVYLNDEINSGQLVEEDEDD